jgi:hypothetical protein
VQTLKMTGLPSTTARTLWMLGSQTFLVLMFEWLTLWPT